MGDQEQDSRAQSPQYWLELQRQQKSDPKTWIRSFHSCQNSTGLCAGIFPQGQTGAERV